MDYSKWVSQQLDEQWHLQVGHFRDIWGGLPIIGRKHLTSVFEVNGLPSIELQNRYPYLSDETLSKVKEMEDHCLHQSNLIVCPSHTIKRHLLSRSVLEDKIHVISNGADIPDRYPKLQGLPSKYVLYFGALQPWQGVDVLMKAFQYLRDKPEIKLVICSSHKEKFSRPYVKLANKLALDDQIIWFHKLGKQQLFQVIQHAICTVAPLTECARNLEQGCSPLKIFESMACQTPIVASDLPVVREIIADDEGKFFRPDRPAELARAIRLITDYPDHGKEIASKAFKKLIDQFTWEKVDHQLSDFYDKLVTLAYT